MDKIKQDLKKYGITDPKKIYYNLGYDELFKHETHEDLNGFEKGIITSTGAVTVDTGIYTGRSPKDKYIVEEESSKDNIWWKNPFRKNSDNKPISKEIWKELYEISSDQLNKKSIYVMDGYSGANEDSRLKIRIVTEVAWMAHFVKNMFIRPTEEELKDF